MRIACNPWLPHLDYALDLERNESVFHAMVETLCRSDGHSSFYAGLPSGSSLAGT